MGLCLQQVLKFISMSTVAWSLLAGCKPIQTSSSSDIKIINGRKVAAASATIQDRLKSVVKITTPGGSSCTGTFVSPSVMITAAHCVVDDDKNRSNIRVNGKRSTLVITVTGYKNNEHRIAKTYDFAVVGFPRNTASRLGINSFIRLARRRIQRGDKVIVAGYGRATKDGNSGIFRYGFNTVDTVTDRQVFVAGTHTGRFDGTDAVSHKGDSGGPLLNADYQLVGTTRGGKWSGNTKHEDYHNVLSPTALSAFRYAQNCSKYSNCTEDFYNSRAALKFDEIKKFSDSAELIDIVATNDSLYVYTARGNIYGARQGSAQFEKMYTAPDNFSKTGLAADGDNLYLSSRRFLLKSTNYGQSFDKIHTFAISQDDTIDSIWVTGDTIYVGTLKTIWKSNDGGQNFQKIFDLPSKFTRNKIAADDDYVYLLSKRNLYRSTNGGSSFDKVLSGVADFDSRDITVANGKVYIATQRSLLISRDRGETAEEIWDWMEGYSNAGLAVYGKHMAVATNRTIQLAALRGSKFNLTDVSSPKCLTSDDQIRLVQLGFDTEEDAVAEDNQELNNLLAREKEFGYCI